MTHRSAPNEAVVANAIPITTLIIFAALEVPVSTITMGARYGLIIGRVAPQK